MKKLFSLLFWTLAMATLFLPKHTNGQSEYFNVDTVYNDCNEKIALAIWAKQSTLDSFSFDQFSIRNRNYKNIDTAIIELLCHQFAIYAGFIHESRFHSQFVMVKGKQCSYPYLNWEWPIDLDSATQTGSSQIFIKDTNTNITWTELSVIKKFEPNGKSTKELVKTYDLKSAQNPLGDSLPVQLEKGKYELLLKGINKLGCDVKVRTPNRPVGHFQNTQIDKKGYIHDSIYYFYPYGNIRCDLSFWLSNTSCIDTNGLFYSPDSNALRKYWYKESSNYNGPKIKEAIFYDFNSDGVIDSMRPNTKYTSLHLNSRLAAVRIPEKYQQDTLTVWSRDSLGQWQKSEPIPYTNCSYFKRHDYLNFTKYNGECQFSSNGKYKSDDTLHIKIRKFSINGSDTSFTNYDAFSFQANSQIFKALDYGHYVIERVTNNGICDAPINDTVVSCAGFNEIIEDSVFQDSLSIFNGFSSKSDSILIKVFDTLNNWVVIDSVWLGSEEQYINIFPNGNYFVSYYSNTLDCGYERMWNLHNSSIEGLSNNSIRIYPNPNSGNLNLVQPTESSTYRLIDLTGREIQNGNLSEGVNKISIRSVPSGIYLIEIKMTNSIIKKRIVRN